MTFTDDGVDSIHRNYNGIIDLRSFSIDESTLMMVMTSVRKCGNYLM